MPIIGHVFDLEARDLFIIQIIIGVLLFWALAKLAEKVTGDRVCATLLTLGFTCIYVGKACFLDLKFGWFDGVAYFLLIMSMLYRNIILIFLFLF